MSDGSIAGTAANRRLLEPVKAKPKTRRSRDESYDSYREIGQTALIVGAVIAAVIIILVALTFVVKAPTANPEGDTQTAQPLVGTWVTSDPALFIASTNWPTGNMTAIGYENRSYTFVITGTDDPAIVNVYVTYTVLFSNIGQGEMYGTEPTPNGYQGKVNGTTLTLEQDGLSAFFTYDGGVITGNWYDRMTFSYFTEDIQSGNGGFTLIKQ